MNSDQFNELVLRGRETRNLEFKQSSPWTDKRFQAKITRSALALSNVRDGGHIVIGITESTAGGVKLEGISPRHLRTYKEDTVKSVVNRFADPYVLLELNNVNHQGKNFLVISVQEFTEIPVICKQDGLEKLRRGAIYTRTHRIPESAEVPSQTEMREILNMASEKRLRAYFRMQQRVEGRRTEESKDSDRFNAELEDLL